MGYVYIKYEEYYHKTDGDHKGGYQTIPTRWMNAAQGVVSDVAVSVKLRMMEFLMVVGTFLIVVIVCSAFLWWFMSLGSPSSAKSSGTDVFASISAFISLNIYVAIFVFVLGGGYFVYTWNNRRVQTTETEVMSYALKAKEFLISLRVADSDGVAMSMFIEEFLDHLKLGHPSKRKRIKSMWKEIEEAMLDDKRVVKTGRMSLPNGGTDCKYKYTKLATHSSKLYGSAAAPPVFAYKSNANPNEPRPSSPYAPRGGAGFWPSSAAHSSNNAPNSRTLHKPNDPVVANTGLSGTKTAAPAPAVKKSSIFGAFW